MACLSMQIMGENEIGVNYLIKAGVITGPMQVLPVF